MVKSFRFLIRFAWVNLASLLGFAAIVIVGCYLTGVPGNPNVGNLFETYYAMFPTMILLCLFLYAFAMCTNNLNLGLSMGARRRDFFWAIQGNMAFYAVVCWGLQLFMSAFPALAGWEIRDKWALLDLFGGRVWAFPLVCLVLMVLGCLSGMVLVKNKVLGGILVTLSIFVMIFVTVFMLLSAETSLLDFLAGSVWNDLPKILVGALAAAFAGGEVLIWRTIQRYVVR